MESDIVKNSDDSHFPQDVVEASKQDPVLVDFFAPWCEPSKKLTPILETVVCATGGRVRLVRINVDENPALLQQLRVRGVPTVLAFLNGKQFGGFLGLKTDDEVRAIVDRLVTAAGGKQIIKDAAAAAKVQPSQGTEPKEKAEPVSNSGAAGTACRNSAPTSAPGGGTGSFMAIDFGTTNSSMAWYNPASGSAEPIRNEEGEEQTPSAVYYGEQETLVGEPALDILKELRDVEDEQERAREATRLIRSIKRNLTDQHARALPDGRTVTPVDVAAEIIAKLKHDAEKGHFREPVRRVVLTCPAEFDELQRGLLEQAARQAGFEEVKLLEEPEAAAIAYARTGLKVGNGVLVYDLGGGTLDLAIVARKGDGQYERAMEAMGDAQCGGDDFDQALYGHWEEEVRRLYGRGLGTHEYRADPYFLAEARQRKEALTRRETVGSLTAALPGGGIIKLAIDRPTFERLIAPRVDQTVEKAARMYQEAKERGHEVDTVVLIGGASLIPLIRRRLAEVLPLEPQQWQYQHVAVALGAAYHGWRLWSNASTSAPRKRPQKPSRPPRYRCIARLDPSFDLSRHDFFPDQRFTQYSWEAITLAPDGKRVVARLKKGGLFAEGDMFPVVLLDLATHTFSSKYHISDEHAFSDMLVVPNSDTLCVLGAERADSKYRAYLLIYNLTHGGTTTDTINLGLSNNLRHELCYSPNALYAGILSAGRTKVLDGKSYKTVGNVTSTAKPSFSTDGCLMASCDGSRIFVWALPSMDKIGIHELRDNARVTDIGFLPDNASIAYAASTGGFFAKSLIERWEIGGRKKTTLTIGSLGRMAVCPDGSILAITRANEVELIDSEDGRQVAKLCTDEMVWQEPVYFADEGKRIALFVRSKMHGVKWELVIFEK